MKSFKLVYGIANLSHVNFINPYTNLVLGDFV